MGARPHRTQMEVDSNDTQKPDASWLKSACKAGRVWLMSKMEVESLEPPHPGWREGVARCPQRGGGVVEGHVCPTEFC